MDTTVAAVWVRLASKGRKAVKIGFIYREHQFIWQDVPGNSVSPQQQQDRWNLFIEKWKLAAARNSDVIVLGDLNLDYLTWAQPHPGHIRMIDKVKVDIETLGFNQMIDGATIIWKDQPDSNIDHCWLNSPWRLNFYKNVDRAASDHNLILINLGMKFKLTNTQEFTRRDRKNLNVEDYKSKIAAMDWSAFDNCDNLEVLNNIFEKNLIEVLDTVAPIKTSQLKNWITTDMKDEMSRRDELRQIARNSGRLEDWEFLKRQGTSVLNHLQNVKKKHITMISIRKWSRKKLKKGLYSLTK